MREYLPTAEAKNLAIETGVQALADRLHDKDYDHPLFTIARLTQERFGWQEDSDEDVSVEVRTTRDRLRTPDERFMFDRAMAIDSESDSWRLIGDYEDGTLFPVRSIHPFTSASLEDRLVLSGAAGLSLVSFRQRCPLLSRNRYEEYGFQTFTEACAFVGGCVVGRLVELESRRLSDKEPSFGYVKDGTDHRVSVGGSFHGDFRMTETLLPLSDVVSPINTMTKFSPLRGLAVAGYHSVEPEIVATLIESEFIKSGKVGAIDLVNEFIGVLTEASDETGKIGFRSGAFADYGDGDARLSLTSLRLLLTHEDYHERLRDRETLHSSPYLPQSSTMFEILSTERGVKFQNKDDRNDVEVHGINIDREQYRELLKALIRQTAGGLGRTAPSQLNDLVVKAKSLLEGDIEVDY